MLELVSEEERGFVPKQNVPEHVRVHMRRRLRLLVLVVHVRMASIGSRISCLGRLNASPTLRDARHGCLL